MNIREYRTVLITLMLVACLVSGAVAGWAIIFGACYSALIAIMGVLVFVPLFVERRYIWYARGAIFLIGMLPATRTFRLPIMEVSAGINNLAQKAGVYGTQEAFSLRDKLGTDGLNMIMSLMAYPI
jgi:hypothetical protein